MFILGMNEEDYRYAMDQQDYALLNKYLYRVQKLSKSDYSFRYHTETSVEDKYDGKPNLKLSMQMGKLKRVSIKSLLGLNLIRYISSVLSRKGNIMIKRTLYFGNPSYLSLRNAQLVLRLPEVSNNDTLPDTFKKEAERTIPIEDIGVVVLDHSQITITQGLLEALLENNCAIITCDKSRLPVGLILPLCGNTTQNERFRDQLNASLPLKKQLWQQTVQQKIANQAAILESQGIIAKNMRAWVGEVRSGDIDNMEARAAAYYWSSIFPHLDSFRRDRDGDPPNNLLNYGYAILRAVVARSLVISGLLPTLGIHHHNRYNAYCLADDVMEPYRPYVDGLVCEIMESGKDYSMLTTELKAKLLSLPVVEVGIQGRRSPLMVAVAQTTASLYKCFNGELRKIIYPEL